MKKELNTLLNRVDTRLAACAAAAGASLALVPASNADIVYSGVVNYNIQNANINGLYINFVLGTTNLIGAGAGTTVPGWDFNPYSSSGTPTGSLNFFASGTGNAVVGAGGVAAAIPFGNLIGPASTFITGVISATPFRTTDLLYAGIRFQNEGTGVVNYGWALFSTTPTTGFPATLVSYAYDNTGAGIAAGAIPEPTTLALLGVMAAGALGVRAWRKRKAA